MYPVPVIGEFLLKAASVFVVTATTVKLFQKSSDFPKWYHGQYLASLGVPAVDWVLVAVTIGEPSRVLRPDGALWFATLVIGGLLVRYVSQSRRVENTFVR
jgi:hypothetical protein